MKKRLFLLIILLIACLLIPVSAAYAERAGDKPGDAADERSEGVDTPCEVQFVQYTGPWHDLFLSEGDRIAVISPSSLPSREQVDAVVNGLREWGYTPVEGKHVCEEVRTLGDCLEDLKWALEDPSVKAIFCVRGGYGASEVMDQLPEGLIASSCKLIIGYSDITVYHSAWTVAGLPSVHSPMSSTFTDLPEANAEAVKRLLQGEMPVYTCKNGLYYRTGKAEGVLIGGNLSTLTATLNTAYDCTAQGVPYILFLEDVGENLQHIHRYLTVLKHFDVLDRASGLIFGEWTEIPLLDEDDIDANSRGGDYKATADMITREFTGSLEIPVAFGFPAGHGKVNWPLLMGVKARLIVTEDSYRIEYPADP